MEEIVAFAIAEVVAAIVQVVMDTDDRKRRKGQQYCLVETVLHRDDFVYSSDDDPRDFDQLHGACQNLREPD